MQCTYKLYMESTPVMQTTLFPQLRLSRLLTWQQNKTKSLAVAVLADLIWHGAGDYKLGVGQFPRTIPPDNSPGQFPRTFWVGHFPPDNSPQYSMHTYLYMYAHIHTYIHTYI